ncbi:UNVERIFIED_CONTAM: hypothetical protein Sradi_5525600 [Sesamum radiatum]|uniref:Uncharacterized protein n=1 Tax=Sesamum radiatum TaxID=300843 RepID=A0AAW2LBK1_SESRA
MSKRCNDQVSQWASDQLPHNQTLPSDYYNTKKLIPDLGLPVENIHACEHMAWHACYKTDEGSMCHPSDAEAWMHFDKPYPDFVVEPRNVTLVLCTDGFAPHGGIHDACGLMWTVNDLFAYGMTFGWSTTGGTRDPSQKIDRKERFARPRLTGDEIRHRVEQYGTAVEEPLTYPLGYGNVHKWIKKNIFWDLPYWNTHLIRHNLDVMHIEKNVFDNIFNTVMDIKGKSKDNLNARKDLKNICNRSELEVGERIPNAMPKAAYTLTKEQKKKKWDYPKNEVRYFFDKYASKWLSKKFNEARTTNKQPIWIANDVWASLLRRLISVAHLSEWRYLLPAIRRKSMVVGVVRRQKRSRRHIRRCSRSVPHSRRHMEEGSSSTVSVTPLKEEQF